MSRLRKAVEDMAVEVVGVLGRPLYVCTARPFEGRPERLCMSTASMSPLIQLSSARRHYLCVGCKSGGKAPVSDSAPLRVLHLHVTVAASDGLPTPVRMKPVPVVLEAPPDSFAWGSPTSSAPRSLGGKAADGPALTYGPKRMRSFKGEASDAIWHAAKAFRGSESAR